MKAIQGVNLKDIKKRFEIETGKKETDIEEIGDGFPYSKVASIKTIDQTYYFMLTPSGRAKKNTFQTEAEFYDEINKKSK